jgi:hypothetical protein
LNEDPFNVRAEDLAVEECRKGFIVEKLFNETDMLVESCGCLIPGTPDGGFEDSSGALTLVQVVRVPLLPEMDADTVGDVLYSTVLAKIVKSQQWMQATSTLPREFIIFCWLPPVGAYEACMEQTDALLWTEALLWNVRAGGWPFTLRIMVPPDPGRIFPNNFGLNSDRHSQAKMNHYWNGLCYKMNLEDFREDQAEDEETMEWFLFEEDVDQDIEESDSKLSPPVVCMRSLVFLIDRVLEDFERREQTEWLAPVELVHCSGSFADPMSLQIFERSQPCLELASAARDRERNGPLIPPTIQGLPHWDVKWLWRGPLESPGCYVDEGCVEPPIFDSPVRRGGRFDSFAVCF